MCTVYVCVYVSRRCIGCCLPVLFLCLYLYPVTITLRFKVCPSLRHVKNSKKLASICVSHTAFTILVLCSIQQIKVKRRYDGRPSYSTTTISKVSN
jgi:hypothetical protein